LKTLILVVAALLIASPAAAAPVYIGYAVDAAHPCGGYARLPIGMAKGLCAGLVYGPSPADAPPSKRTLRLPRTLLPLANGDLLVVDLGGWLRGQGSVWRLTPRPGGQPTLKRLLDKLDLPHTAAFGPDGKVYLGEMSRIVRFDPDAADPPSTVETVVSGLPDNSLHPDRHPLSSFLFDRDNALLVNVGAPTDQCPPAAGATRCPQAEGDHPQAAIWRFAYLGGGRWAQTPTTYARGLRNSLALAMHSSGAIFQGENGIDLTSADAPYDVINRLRAGANYGWPYCIEATAVAPAWRGKSPLDCAGAARTRPVLMLPPHGAPLSMLYYSGAMFPTLAGKLIVSLHGYRATGSRIVAFSVDATGAPIPNAKPTFAVYGQPGAAATRRAYREGPAANGFILTPGWDAVKGRRPSGAPVGFAVTPDGALWVAEDRNGTIVRIAKDGG